MEEAECALEREISESFLVEDLLNFDGHEEKDDDLENAPSESILEVQDCSSLSSSLSSEQFAGDISSHRFSIPHEDREELEWLSNFVEESFSGENQTKFDLISSPISIPGKARTKRARLTGPGSHNGPARKKCLHCLAERTPQWRTGPNGPKTLCNACGVRYKSGRLVPEYRPAASPTFVPAQHSNSHRKVVQLRRQKEVKAAAAPEESET